MRRTSLAACVLAFACSAPAFAQDLDNRFDRADQVREILSEAVKEFRTGRYDEAARRLHDALAANPDNKLLYEFYLAMGNELIIRMQRKDELDDVMSDILRRANIYQKSLRRTPEYIDLLIQKLDGSEEERLVATSELVAVGPRAAPALLQLMADNREDMRRVRARVALTKMGRRAVVPLVEALESDDERLVTSAITVFTDIRDTRPLPYLVRLKNAEDTSDTLKRVAGNAIEAIKSANGLSRLAEPEILFFQEALRYFRGGSQVRDEAIANEGLMWSWTDDGLQYTQAPLYAWNELMSEQVLFDASQHYGEQPSFLSLMGAVFAAQDHEANRRLELAKERDIPAERPEETVEALEERVAALSEMRDRVIMLGGQHLSRSIQQAIVSERYPVAAYLMDVLSDAAVTDPGELLPAPDEGLAVGKPGTVLVAALDHPSKMVRYHAAITLAKLDPTQDFFGADKVMPLVSEAIGEWGMKVVLVVEPDYRHRNGARRQLLEQGYLVVTAADGFEAMQRLRETPVKDAVIIAGDIVPTLRDEYGTNIDVPQQTAEGLVELIQERPSTSETPILVALPEDPQLRVKVRNEFDGEVSGFVGKPYAGVEMAGAVDKAMGDDEMPSVNREDREDVSLAAARALAGVDVDHSHYDLRSQQVLNALQGTLATRAEPIRINALHALGHTGIAERVDAVTAVYEQQDAQLTVPLRKAFLYAIGELDPTTAAAQRILEEALEHDDRGVRLVAAKAIGSGSEIAPTTLYQYQRQQRLNARSAGAGTE